MLPSQALPPGSPAVPKAGTPSVGVYGWDRRWPQTWPRLPCRVPVWDPAIPVAPTPPGPERCPEPTGGAAASVDPDPHNARRESGYSPRVPREPRWYRSPHPRGWFPGNPSGVRPWSCHPDDIRRSAPPGPVGCGIRRTRGRGHRPTPSVRPRTTATLPAPERRPRSVSEVPSSSGRCHRALARWNPSTNKNGPVISRGRLVHPVRLPGIGWLGKSVGRVGDARVDRGPVSPRVSGGFKLGRSRHSRGASRPDSNASPDTRGWRAQYPPFRRTALTTTDHSSPPQAVGS